MGYCVLKCTVGKMRSHIPHRSTAFIHQTSQKVSHPCRSHSGIIHMNITMENDVAKSLYIVGLSRFTLSLVQSFGRKISLRYLNEATQSTVLWVGGNCSDFYCSFVSQWTPRLNRFDRGLVNAWTGRILAQWAGNLRRAFSDSWTPGWLHIVWFCAMSRALLNNVYYWKRP